MTITLPTEGFGIYEGVNPSAGPSVYQPRLQQIAQAGFKFVINYNNLHGHISDLIAYINYAASQGLKVLVNLSDARIWQWQTNSNLYAIFYPQIYSDSGNAATGILFAQYVVNQVKSLSGVWGYYIGDEVYAADHTTFKGYADAIKAADSTHPRLVIESAIAGSNVNTTNCFGYGTTLMWDCCDVGGDDAYPINFNVVPNYTTLATVASGIQSFCTSKGLDTAMVLQAHSFAPYGTANAPWPTEDQMLQMRNTVLTNMKPRIIFWYSYFDVINTGSPDFAPAQQWNYLINAMGGKSGVALFPTMLRRGSPSTVDYSTTVTGDSPIAYYRMNEASGSTIHDATVNHYDGLLHGSSTVNQPGPVIIPSDTSVLFNGTSSYAVLPSNVNGNGFSAITIECWFNLTSLTFAGGFATIITSGIGTGYALIIASPKTLSWTVYNNSTHGAVSFAPATFQTGVWYHIAAIYNGSGVFLYWNGSQVAGPNALTGAIYNSVSSQQPYVSTGLGSGAFYLPAYMGQLAIYNQALTSSQILNHYRVGTETLQSSQALFPTMTRRQS